MSYDLHGSETESNGSTLVQLIFIKNLMYPFALLPLSLKLSIIFYHEQLSKNISNTSIHRLFSLMLKIKK